MTKLSLGDALAILADVKPAIGPQPDPDDKIVERCRFEIAGHERALARLEADAGHRRRAIAYWRDRLAELQSPAPGGADGGRP